MTQNGEMSMKWLGKREFVPLILFLNCTSENKINVRINV